MTQSSEPDRLDRIEALLERLAVELTNTQKIVQSNARSIQAESEEAKQHRRDMRQLTRDLMARNFENLTQHQEFREAMVDFRETLDRYFDLLRTQLPEAE